MTKRKVSTATIKTKKPSARSNAVKGPPTSCYKCGSPGPFKQRNDGYYYRSCHDCIKGLQRTRQHKIMRKATIEIDPLVVKMLEFAKKGVHFSDLCNLMDLSPRKTEALIKKAQARNASVHVEHDTITIAPSPALEVVQDIKISKVKGRPFKFGAISDTHLGSKYCLRGPIRETIKWMYDAGVRDIVHSGDVLEGCYRHAQYELSHSGFDAQLRDAAKCFPQLPKLRYHFITGNHDFTFEDKIGMRIGVAIQDGMRALGRNDWICYGDRNAYLSLGGAVINLYHPGGGSAYARCFDDQTEVLTRAGWKSFDVVTKDDEIATLNNAHEIEWQRPSEVHAYDYNGEMLQTQSRLVDLCVTPNHNLYVQNDKTKEWSLKEAQVCEETWMRFAAQGNWRMKKDAKPQVGPKPEVFDVPELEKRHNKPVKHLGRVPMHAVLKFMGYYVSEGCVSKGRSGHEDGRVMLSQYRDINPEVHADMVATVRLLGLSPAEKGTGVDVASRELAALALEGGRGSYQKKVPQWIKELDASLLSVFFEAYMAGDGTEDSTGHRSAVTVSKQLADDLQEIALRLGFSAAVNWSEGAGKYGAFQVSFNEHKNEPRMDRRPERVQYDGKVYCVTVPNHTLYVRRNGKSVWSGNSYNLQKRIEAYTAIKPQFLFMGHYHQWNYCYERGIHAFMMPCFQGSGSNFAQSLKGPPSIGGLLIECQMSETGRVHNVAIHPRFFFERDSVFSPRNDMDAIELSPVGRDRRYRKDKDVG